MKARAKVLGTSGTLFLMFILSFFVASKAQAHHFVPVAICSTSGTNIPFPYYVCCQKLDDGHHIWRDTWVPVSCKHADSEATFDMGCKVRSPVYNTGKPIVAECQFSYSTGKYL